jgi:signal peptidase II
MANTGNPENINADKKNSYKPNPPSWKLFTLFMLLTLTGFFLDLWTKKAAFSALTFMAITDTEGKIIKATPANPKVVNFHASEVLGKNFDQVLEPNLAENIKQVLQNARQNNDSDAVSFKLNENHTTRETVFRIQAIFQNGNYQGARLTYVAQKPVFKWFTLVARENAGAAWSIASGKSLLLITISLIALIIVFAVFIFGIVHRKITCFALALFTAGVLGNLYDRIFNNGLVRDFIDLHINDKHWPAFNLADSLLCIAVVILLLSSFLQTRDHQKSQT